MEWRTPVGHFMYRTLKPRLYFGYQLSDTQPQFLIASPEKVLIDMLYLNPYLSEPGAIEELRLNAQQVQHMVDVMRLQEYIGYIGSPALTRRLEILHKIIFI